MIEPNDGETDYFAINALSNSALSCLKRSPEAFRDQYLLGLKQPESDAFKIGSAVHCLVLEPWKFSERYAMAPKVDRRTKQGKADWEAFQESVQGRELLTDDENTQVVNLARAFGKHAGLTVLLGNENKIIEQPITFELFGHDFKAKPDCVIPSLKTIIDVKTCKDSNPNRWKWSAVDYGYHRQAAIYQHACKVQYKEDFRFLFACVTKSYPFEVALIELESRSVCDGMDEVESLVAEYDRRLENKDWLPNHSKGVVSLRLPKTEFFAYEED